MIETSSSPKTRKSWFHETPAIIGGAGSLIAWFMAMNAFAIANSPFLTEVEMLVLSPLYAALVGICLYVISASYIGDGRFASWITKAALPPSLLIAFQTGLYLSVFMHGADGPWSEVFEGLSGPVADGLLNGALWPITFLIGASLGAAFCYGVFKLVTRRIGLLDDQVLRCDSEFDNAELADLGVMGSD